MTGSKSLTDAVKRSAGASLSSAVKAAVSGRVRGEPARSLAVAVRQSAQDVKREGLVEPSVRPRTELTQELVIVSEAVAAMEPRQLPPLTSASAAMATVLARRVFVVHGHDELAKANVVRFLERMQFEAIVLNEQTNQGRTIIEKIESYRDVSFAVVLLTPDDVCETGGILMHRARQNVIWELGYFTALIGRNRVCVLRKGDVELPSDMLGVAWTELDARGAWQIDLARELKEAGFSVSIPL